MKKRRIAELYRFLSMASMKRMTDDEKVSFIRLLRTMKPVAEELQSAANDALEKAHRDCDDESKVLELVNRAMDDIANESVVMTIKTMSADTFNHLCMSNDWTFAQIDELENELVA